MGRDHRIGPAAADRADEAGPEGDLDGRLPPAGTLTSPDPRTTSVSRQSWKTLTRNLPVRPFGFLTATVAVEVDDE
ncbi:hypothetical protein [Streptomyces sp. NPDC004680]|uniref:hypothetical protein n=1 Tax=Streptomyces sp. NPDC004680 TaxID=3154287 RepID=UPI0033B14F2C